jgi:hypothetical protein
MKYRKSLLVFLLFLGTFSPLLAQENCMDALDKAKQMYTEGNIYNIPFVLGPHLKTNCFEKSQLAEAYRLLGLVYDETDKKDSVVYNITQMLKLVPTYKARATDVKTFAERLNEFKVFPKISVSVFAGLNLSLIRPVAEYQLFEGNSYIPSYTLTSSSMYGASVQYAFHRNFGVSMGLIRNTYQYGYNYESVLKGSSNAQVTIKYNYEQFMIYNQAFASLFYRQYWGHYRSQIGFGYNLAKIADSYRDVFILFEEAGVSQQNEPIETYSVFTLPFNQSWLHGFNLSTSVGRQFKNAEIGVEITYMLGRTNTINPRKRFTVDNLIYGFYDLEDDKHMDNLSISLKYTYTLNYTVKRKKSAL